MWTPEPAKVGIAARMVHRRPERDLAAAASAATMRPMADIWTKAKRSEVMARIRGRGNRTTEVRLAAIFRAHGIKVRVRRSASKG